MRLFCFILFICALIAGGVLGKMTDLGISQDSNVTDSLPVIQDVGVDATSNRVLTRQIPTKVGADFNILKIVKTINTSITLTGGDIIADDFQSTGGQKEIAHQLGYKPAAIGFISNADGSGEQQLPYTFMLSFGGGIGTGASASWLTIQLSTDETNVYIQANEIDFNSSPVQQTFLVKILLLQESAN